MHMRRSKEEVKGIVKKKKRASVNHTHSRRTIRFEGFA